MTCHRLLCPTIAFLIAPIASGAISTWDAGGPANDFGDAGNWVGDVPFTDGDDVVFSAPGTPSGTAFVLLDRVINSATFNADADLNTVLATTGPTGEINLTEGITVDGGSDGQHRVDARLTVTSNVDFVNNSVQPFTTNARIRNGVTPGGVTFAGNHFLEGGRNANNTFTGDFVIERGTVQVRTSIIDTATRGTFGLGDVVLGETGSTNNATLLINTDVASANATIIRPLVVTAGDGDRILGLAPPSTGIRTVRWGGDITLDGDLGVRVAGFEDPFRAGFLWLNGKITGNGNLNLFNAGGTDGSLAVMNNAAGDNDFVGTVNVDTVVQVRDANAFGDAGNSVVVGGNNAQGDGDVILFIDRGSATNGNTSGTIVQNIDLQAGSVGVAADFNVFEPVTATYGGNITIGQTDVTLGAAASNSTNVAGGTQDLTLEFNGDITGGNAANVLSITGGNGEGTVTGTSKVVLRGNSDYQHSTALTLPNAGGDLTVTLDGGTLNVNNGVSIGAGATLDGDSTNGGSLAFDLNDTFNPLISLDGGTLDITNLALDIDASAFTGTEAVLADYAAGTLTGAAFTNVTGVGNFSIDYLTNNQITISLLATSGIIGDYDNDGQVAQGDLNLVLNNWGAARTFEDPGGTVFATANVDQEELNGVLNNWGAQSAPSFAGSAVPEPATLAVLGGLGLMNLRRRSA
ncbi:MAG: PEP-CTERM sorting domain-containing protein [Planctomycetota bacterium]